jgi:hypothetical protein
MIAALEWPVTSPEGGPLVLLVTGYVVRIRRPMMIALSTATNKLLRTREMGRRFEFLFSNGAESSHFLTGGTSADVLNIETDHTGRTGTDGS